jgi:iron complex transport system substrate-binding protein
MRIVSLISAATEMLYELGLGEQIVAVSHECDWPPPVADKPRVTFANIDSTRSSADIDRQVADAARRGAALYGIDAPLLARLAPDLIVTQAQCDVCAVSYDEVAHVVGRTTALGQTQIIALRPDSLADVLDEMVRIGEAAGIGPNARHCVDRLAARIEAVGRRVVSLADTKPRVAMIEWIQPLMLAGNWVPRMVELAGGLVPSTGGLAVAAEKMDLSTAGDSAPTPGGLESATGESMPGTVTAAAAHSRYVDWDELTAFDPQVIIVAPCGFDVRRTLDELSAVLAVPEWPGLSAVRAGRVFAVDGNAYFNRPGPRLIESLELLAHLLHPREVPPPRCTSPDPWRAVRPAGQSPPA